MCMRMAISGQHAEILVAVADAGSFLKAASLLGVTQPTLSRTVADLEDELGFKLFVRHARGVRLTPEGATLIAPARRVVSAVHGLERVARATRDTSGTLRLTTSEYIGIEVLVPRLPEFYDQHPNVSVEFVLNNTSTDLPQPQKSYLGWRTSWCGSQHMPEKCNRNKVLKRLTHQWELYKDTGIEFGQRVMAPSTARTEHAEQAKQRRRERRADDAKQASLRRLDAKHAKLKLPPSAGAGRGMQASQLQG